MASAIFDSFFATVAPAPLSAASRVLGSFPNAFLHVVWTTIPAMTAKPTTGAVASLPTSLAGTIVVTLRLRRNSTTLSFDFVARQITG